MKKIILLLTGIVCLLHLSSCLELDLTPPHQVVAETSIQSEKDVKVMMDGLMRNLCSGSYYGRDMLLYADAKGGDYIIPMLGRGYDGLYRFEHAVGSGSYSSFWYQIYICLALSNNILEGIAKLEAGGTETPQLSKYKGQALTLRALMHFDLARLYGYPYLKDNGASLGAPIVTKVLSAFDQPRRETVAAMYAQISEDLIDGAALLNNSIGKTKEQGYVNYYANKALQAKVYLYMGKYDESLAAAEEVMAPSAGYSLYSNANWKSSWTKQNQSESIFELDMRQNETDLGTSSLGYMTIRPRKIGSNAGLFMASKYFMESLEEDPDDVRWGVMSNDESTWAKPSRKGCCYKYLGDTLATGDGKGLASAVNIKVIRLSEVYLIAAEAALSQPTPDKTKAAAYLQKIRDRSPSLTLSDPATVDNISIDMILKERQKELFGEGQRFFDLMRLGKTILYADDEVAGIISGPRTAQGGSVNWNFYASILPISQGELDANPAIRDQQNPGY